MHKLRAKFVVQDMSSQLEVWNAFQTGGATEIGTERFDQAVWTDRFPNASDALVTAMQDPRLPALGSRAIVHADQISQNSELDTDIGTFDAYRMALGVPESTELDARMPLECNLETLNAISFDKGCYVGQELIARTHYRGTIRKRLMPFRLDNPDDVAAISSALQDPKAKVSGTPVKHATSTADTLPMRGSPARVIAVHETAPVGLAMVRLESLGADAASRTTQSFPFELAVEGTSPVPISVEVPAWWPEDYLGEKQ